MNVSVVIPTLNAARYLADALESVQAQTHAPFEVVVVDGGSTDGTLEIAAGHARVIAQAGSGLPDAWNCGIAASRGELVAFLDSDDRWLPEKLARQLEVIDDADCAITRMRFALEPGFAIPTGFRAELLESDHLAQMPSALLARRALFERIGNFDTRWPIASDVAWFARLKDLGAKVAVVSEVLVEKRVHDANLSTLGGVQFNRELLELLRESVARRSGRRPSDAAG